MKKSMILNITLLVLLSAICTYAQDPILKKSMVSRSPYGGGTSTDFTSVTGYVLDKDGNRYMSGRYKGTYDFDPGLGTVNYTSTNTGASAGYDFYITKLDKNDNLIWAKVIGSTGDNESVRNMAVDANGNVIVTGVFREDMDFDPGAATFTISNGTTPSDFKSLFMLKLDANGDFLWAKNFQANTTGGLVVTVDDMSVDSQNNILCSGYFYGTMDFDPTAGTAIVSAPSNAQDGYFLKIDATGNYVFHKQYGPSYFFNGSTSTTQQEYGRSSAVDASGNIFSLLTFKDFTGLQYTVLDKYSATGTLLGFYITSMPTTTSPVYLKTVLDKLGNVFISANRSVIKISTSSMNSTTTSSAALWTKPIVGFHIGIDNNNNIIKTGNFSSGEDFDPSTPYYTITPLNSFSDALISKMDNNGNFIYAKGLGAANNGNAGVARQNITSYGDIQVWGYFENSIDVDPSAMTKTLTNTTGLSSPGFWATYSLPCTGVPNSSSISATACGSYRWAKKAATYTISGIYKDTLTNVAGCDSIITLNLTINPLPSINLTNNNGTILTCTNPSTTITASGASSYAWTGAGGFIASTAAATISTVGTYVVTGTGPLGCTSTVNVVITEDKTAPTAVITPTSGIYLTCTNPSTTLTASGGSTYSWTGPGGFTATAAMANITNIGVYTATAIGANGCTATATVNIPGSKSPPPLVVTPTSATLNCTTSQRNLIASGANSYLWTSSTGTYSNSTYFAGVTTPATYTVTATGTNGCTATTSVIVDQDIVPPTVTITPTSAVVLTCANPSITLTASGGGTYLWLGTGATTPAIAVTSNGNYHLTVTGTNGCTTSVIKAVTMDKAVPSSSLVLTTSVLTCANPTTTVTATGVGTYAWTGPGGFTATTAAATFSAAGTYVATITGINGCTATASIAITESKTPPSIGISPPAILTCLNPTITLSASGSGSNSFSWTGPSGFTSTSSNPTININTPGNYTVTGTKDSNGCTASASVAVTESKVFPTVSITPTTAILTCANPSATLTASGGNTYSWTGTGGFTATTALATITNAGTYVVTATATNACTASASVVITENKTTPTVSVTPTSAILTCINPTTTLTGSGGNTYSWTGPGGFTATSATVTIAAAGTFIVTAIGSNGCTATASAVITENKVFPTLSVTPTSAILTCANPTATLTASGGISYSWTGTGGFTATTSAITISNLGTYIVTATGTNACTASVSVAITQNFTPPAVSITLTSATLTCSNPSTTLTANGGSSYSWTGTGGFTATTASVTITTGGTYIVTATGTNGCTATASTTIIDNKVLVATLGPHNPVLTCPFPSRTITALGGSIYSWIGPGGFTASTPNINVTIPGTYTVSVSDGNVCSGTTSVVITENKTPPIATITASSTLLTCTNPSATLTASVGSTYYWAAPQGYAFTQSAINTTLAGPGTYTLFLTGANGCTASTSVNITQNLTPPTISFTPTSSAITCTNPTATITASGGNTYAWTSANSFTSTMASISVSVAGTYNVTATGTNGCSASASVSIANNTATPQASIQPINNTLTCANPTATLTASGGSTYSWTGPNGFSAITASATISNGGIYTLSSTGTNGCTTTSSVNVINGKTTPTVTITPTSPTDAIMTCNLPRVLMEANATGAANPVTYNWTGPNGFVRTGSYPSPVPQAAGLYTVTATDNSGCTCTASITVVDGRTPPTLSVTPTSAILTCTNPTATITASGGSTYEWTKIGGGLNASTTSITISTIGTYKVVATGVNGCTATANVTVTLDKDPPTVNIGGSSNLNCSFPTKTLTGLGADSYSWSDLGGFISTSTTINVSIPGTYFVVGTSNANGCTAARNIVVTENKTPPTITVTPTSASLTCANPSATIIATLSFNSSSNFLWTGPTGFTYTTSSFTPSSSLSIANAGTYTVTGTAGINGCKASVSFEILEDKTPPSISITPTNAILDCNNSSVVLTASGGSTYSWTGTGGFTANTASVSITASGTYTVTATGTNGCINSASKIVIENTIQPTIIITPASTVLNCTNPSLTLTASGGATYKWYFLGILISSSATINVTSPGTYMVTTIGANGCTNFKNVTITENILPPTINLTPTTAILTCSDPSTIITASGGNSYLWTGMGGYTASTASATITTAGTYVVTAMGANGCTATASVNLTQNIVFPTVSVTSTTAILTCANPSTTITASGADSYSWSDVGGFISTSTSINVSVSGTYFVIGTNSANGCTTTRNIVIAENKIPPTATISSAESELTCASSTIILTAAGGNTYSWSSSSGFTSNTAEVSVTQPGTYIVQVTGSNGCTGNKNIVITENKVLPTLTVSGAIGVCAGGNISLNAISDGINFAWTGPSSFVSNMSNTVITNVTSTNSGTYVVTVSGSNGCTNTRSTIVTVNPKPNLVITNPTAALTINLTLPSVTAGSFLPSGATLFYFTDSGGLIPVPNPTNVTSNSIYYIKAIVNGTLCSDFKPVTVIISSGNCLDNLILISTSDDYSSGTTSKQVNATTGTITATNKITGTANVTYRAGKSISLEPGFKVENGTVFKAEYGGCN